MFHGRERHGEWLRILTRKKKQALTSIRKPISHIEVPKTNAAEICEHHEALRSNERKWLKQLH